MSSRQKHFRSESPADAGHQKKVLKMTAANDGPPVDREWSDDSSTASSEDDEFAEISEDDEFAELAEFDWLEPIAQKIDWTAPDGSKALSVGDCVAYLIFCDNIRHAFHKEMHRPTYGTSDLAFELFDGYGRLRDEFKTHCVKKGSGIWQDELGSGDVLLIERLHIQPSYRRRGLGHQVFKNVFEQAKENSGSFFAVVSPGLLVRESEAETKNLTDEEKETAKNQTMDTATKFWRSLGFRRIGSSSWFGISTDPEHPCHSLLATDDFDPMSQATHTPDQRLETLRCISKDSDDESFAQFQKELQDAHAEDPRWRATDELGNTLLHIAALHYKPNITKWILERNLESGILDVRNCDGETPVEALIFHLEAERDRSALRDKFRGVDDAAIDCLTLLRGAKELSGIERARLTYGCTCGSCVGGFLSPSMSILLLRKAESIIKTLRKSFRECSGQMFVENNGNKIEYLQPLVRSNLATNDSMREGFINFFDHFATCIRNEQLPIERSIMQAMQDSSEASLPSRAFLSGGGSVSSVASVVFEHAMAEARWFWYGESMDAPICRNDFEFEFVSAMCGFWASILNKAYGRFLGETIDLDR